MLLRGHPLNKKLGLLLAREKHELNKAHFLAQEATWFKEWSKAFDQDQEET
jgi:hypothetical protein